MNKNFVNLSNGTHKERHHGWTVLIHYKKNKDFISTNISCQVKTKSCLKAASLTHFLPISEAYLEPSQISMMEIFLCENSEQLLAVNYFCRKAQS